jgi:hypothetical protein
MINFEAEKGQMRNNSTLSAAVKEFIQGGSNSDGDGNKNEWQKAIRGAGDDYPVIENTWDAPAPLTRRKDRHYAEDWGKFNTAIFGGSSKELIEEMSNYIRKALQEISLQPKPSSAYLNKLKEGGEIGSLGGKNYHEFKERVEKGEFDNKDVIAPGAFTKVLKDGEPIVDFAHYYDATRYSVYGLLHKSLKQASRQKSSQSRYKKYKRL